MDDGIGLGGSFRKPEVLPEYCLFHISHVIDFFFRPGKKNLKLLESTSELKTHRRSIEVEQERELNINLEEVFLCLENCLLSAGNY